jgi:hypothetical protein
MKKSEGYGERSIWLRPWRWYSETKIKL